MIGVACVGTTTIGSLLAKRLGCPFYDLGGEIERHFGKPVERLMYEAIMPQRFKRRYVKVVLEKWFWPMRIPAL